MRLADFEAMVARMSGEVPREFLAGVGEIVVSPRTLPHPERPGIFTLGECIPLPSRRRHGARRASRAGSCCITARSPRSPGSRPASTGARRRSRPSPTSSGTTSSGAPARPTSRSWTGRSSRTTPGRTARPSTRRFFLAGAPVARRRLAGRRRRVSRPHRRRRARTRADPLGRAASTWCRVPRRRHAAGVSGAGGRRPMPPAGELVLVLRRKPGVLALLRPAKRYHAVVRVAEPSRLSSRHRARRGRGTEPASLSLDAPWCTRS